AEGDRETAYYKAVDQVRYAALRERKAASSIAQIDPAVGPLAISISSSIDQRETQALKELDTYYRAVTKRSPPVSRPQTETDRALAALHPVMVGGPKEFLDGRSHIAGVTGLHSLMSFEVLNLVDGGRSGLDIYRYVAADAREAGDYYFGVVTP